MTNCLVITGASKGIGYATAALFLKHAWKVINISRHPCDLPEVINYQIDLAFQDWQKKHTDELVKQIKNAAKICLVHNAAFYCKDSVMDLPEQQLTKALAINVVAPASLNQIFIPHMRAGSSIIYIGSTLSEKAVKGAASYIISKHAIAGLMKATCQDLDSTGIHTTCVCPGFTDTEMLRSHLKNDPAIIEMVASLNTARRLITPEEIAEIVLMSANNPVLNGAVLHANLGQVER